MVSKCPAHGDANQEGGKEAGLSITEGLFGGICVRLVTELQKLGPRGKGFQREKLIPKQKGLSKKRAGLGKKCLLQAPMCSSALSRCPEFLLLSC